MATLGWRFGGSIALLAAAALACTSPTFVDSDASDRDGTSDEQHDARDGAALEDEHDAAAGPAAASDAASAMDSGDPPDSVSDDGATTIVQDGGAPAPDTGTNGTTPGTDAAITGGLPDWAKPLIGKYAKRSVDFSYDYDTQAMKAFNTRNTEDSILTITQKDDGLEASIQLCRYEVELMGSLPFNFKNARATPPFKGRIVLGSPGNFSSEPLAQQFGFDRARADCGSSGRRTKYSDQTWITSSTTCQCASSRMPMALDDCRLTDGDDDGKAGVTGTGQFVPAPVLSDVVWVFDLSLTMLDGKVMANQAHTLREVRSQGQACLDYANDLCYLGNNQLCPGGTTKLIHDEQVTCANFPLSAFGALPAYPTKVDCRSGS